MVDLSKKKYPEANPIFIRKIPGETHPDHPGLKEVNCLIGFQSINQKNNMKEFAKKCVGCDATYKITHYDYNLITVLVLDEYNEGLPVAWVLL